MQEISLGLTAITDAYLESMLDLVKVEARSDLDVGIIAMGRWGGSELGFGSDADAMLVYQSQELTSQAQAERITQRLLQLVKDSLLEFELDLDLRPEGKNGPRIKSLNGYSGYYEKWAEPWEFQALLRARPVAGSNELQAAFVALIDSYRYPKQVSAKTLIEIRRIKARVETERLPQGADPARHLKLGRGSISDVEWLVQLMQVAHSGTEEALRTLSTVQALGECERLGLIDAEAQKRLQDGWLIASRARSAQVLALDKRVDVLPTDLRQLEAMARILEYQPGEASKLEQDYLAITRRSRLAYEKYFA
jgi:glutamate-ammonia-ligase adenylyltransferase